MNDVKWRTARIATGLWAAAWIGGCIFHDPEAASCRVGATIYDHGSPVPSGDSCNTCSCIDGGVACTLAFCEPDVACGGRLGDTCAEDEYCAYENGDCGFADGTATCNLRPEFCTQIFAPVCGCDGVTYDNACVAAAAGHGYLSEGPCEAEPGEGASCEVDGVTYPDGAGNIPSPDGCNVCFCSDGLLGCTLRFCAPSLP